MLGRALGPVVLHPAVAGATAGVLRRPEVPRRQLSIGVLVTDPGDRPGRGNRLVAGLRLGLERARDLDTVVNVEGASPFGPALLDAATRMLDAGTDVLVVTSAGVATLVAPLCSARGAGLVVADEGERTWVPGLGSGVLRHTEQQWQEAHVLGRWAGRHLEGALFQLVTHEEAQGDAVLALRAGFVETGGAVVGSVEVWPKSATAAAMVARASGARVVAVHATGPRLEEIVGALRAARVPAEIIVAGRGIDQRTLAELGRRGPVYAAASLGRDADERADAVVALGLELAGVLADACRRDALTDLDRAATPDERHLVVRRAETGRTRVVARRDLPVELPDLGAVASLPLIAALPHHG